LEHGVYTKTTLTAGGYKSTTTSFYYRLETALTCFSSDSPTRITYNLAHFNLSKQYYALLQQHKLYVQVLTTKDCILLN